MSGTSGTIGAVSGSRFADYFRIADDPSQGRPQCLYIAHRGLSEEALVLPIELALTFVSYREGCARSIEFLYEPPDT